MKKMTEKPQKDGSYVTISKYGDVREDCYTVESGWNTFRSMDGELFDKYAFSDDDYISAWCKLSDGDPWQTERPCEDGMYVVSKDSVYWPFGLMHFTVNGGWNTSGEDVSNAIRDSYILGWLPIETVKEVLA